VITLETTLNWGAPEMPVEIHSKEEFFKIAERANECRVKRFKNVVKLKLRTKKHLYTLKVKPEEADEILKNVKVKVVEV